MSQSPEVDELIIPSLSINCTRAWLGCVYTGPPGACAVYPSAIVSVDHQMVGKPTYRTTRCVGTGQYVS